MTIDLFTINLSKGPSEKHSKIFVKNNMYIKNAKLNVDEN